MLPDALLMVCLLYTSDIQALTVDQTLDIRVDAYDAIIARGFSARQLKTMYPQLPIIDPVSYTHLSFLPIPCL